MPDLTADERRILRQRIDAARRALEVVNEPGEGERRCFGCKEIKPLDAFCKAQGKSRGRSYQCRACKGEYVKARDRAIRAAGGEAHERLKARTSEQRRRQRAKKRVAGGRDE